MAAPDYERLLALALATAGPIATIGAVYATFQRLRKDVADHQTKDDHEFERIRDTLSEIGERVAAIEGSRGQR